MRPHHAARKHIYEDLRKTGIYAGSDAHLFTVYMRRRTTPKEHKIYATMIEEKCSLIGESTFLKRTEGA